jgi:hypothetical protein
VGLGRIVPADVYGLPEDAHLALRRREQAGDDVHQYRLAGPVLADDAVDLPLLHLHRDVV